MGLAAIGVVVALNAQANGAAWRYPRTIQHVARAIVTPVMELLLNRASPIAEFRREDASKEEPQYLIVSDKTRHQAIHKGSALKKVDKSTAGTRKGGRAKALRAKPTS